jgi:hypothetical protein
MTINREDLDKLKSVLEKNPELHEKLKSATDFKMTSRCLSDIAALNNIPFETTEYELLFNSAQEDFQHRQVSDTELEEVAAGRGGFKPLPEPRYLTDGERDWYAFVYGTGVGAALLSANSESVKEGGAKELADAVFHGGKTNLAGRV